jgi:TonB-linked SusC/RagA family outer membrane protein
VKRIYIIVFLGVITNLSSVVSGQDSLKIKTGFTEINPEASATAAGSIIPDDILAYDNIRSVADAVTGRMTGMTGSDNLRGIGTVLFVVDGVPRDPAFININDIEQITVLKDVHAAILYGNSGASGVVLITTKHGSGKNKEIRVWGDYGIAQPRALPQYLSTADYMENYNIARINDGMEAPYSDETIENFRYGKSYRYPSIDYYSDEFLKKQKTFSNVGINLSGGSGIASYYSSIIWDRQDNLLKIGSTNFQTNAFNFRGNVALEVSNRIKTSIDAVAYFSEESKPLINGGASDYWTEAANLRPDRFASFIPIGIIDPEVALLQAHKLDIQGKYLPGGTLDVMTNPIADIWLAGQRQDVIRDLSFANKIDFDLGGLTEGLALHTNISFDIFSTCNQYVQNRYSVYEPVWDAGQDKVIDLKKFGEDARSGIQQIGATSGQRRIGIYLMLDYHRTFGGIHHLSGNLLGYTTHLYSTASIQRDQNTNLGLCLAYDYGHRYIVDFSAAEVRSIKLHKGNRTAFSPSLALAWVMSNENFMADATWIDLLKVRASAGMMHTDASMGYFLYESAYVTSPVPFYWSDRSRSREGIMPGFNANEQLYFEKRKDVNIGVEGSLFKRTLLFEANGFINRGADLVTRALALYPGYYESYASYENYGIEDHRGFEVGLQYRQKWGDFDASIGGNILYATSKVVQRSEIYADSYRYRTGKPVDAIWGLVADGCYADDIAEGAIPAFGAVQPGDIRYIDQNYDDVVNDDDEKMIGRSQAPRSFGVNLKLSFKGFTLFALGTGRNGASGILSSSYYWAQGDSKYSTYMLNHWTEDTEYSATYPRLSSQANNNNFRSSTFWLYKNDYFSIDRIQLTYDVPIKAGNKLSLRNLSVFVNAVHVFTFSPSKDILLLNIGTEPQYRTFSVGLKTLF